MPTKAHKSIEAQIAAAELAITNTLTDADIKAKVAEKGFSVAELNAALQRVANARSKVAAHKTAEKDKNEATKAEAVAKPVATKAYQDLSKTIKAKFPDGSPQLISVGLNRPMPNKTEDFLTAAETLFANAAVAEGEIFPEGDLRPYIQKRGYTPAKLQSELQKIRDYAAANQLQNNLIGEANTATNEQNDALDELNGWLAEYKKNVKTVLTLQQLRSLGIVTRTTRSQAQKQAAKKASATRKAKKLPK
jgi:hypothetical protein